MISTTQAYPPVHYRLPDTSVGLLSALLGRRISASGSCVSVGDGRPEFESISLRILEGSQVDELKLSTEWYTSETGIDWHAWQVEQQGTPAPQNTQIETPAAAHVADIEILTIDFEETLAETDGPLQNHSIDYGLTLVFDQGPALSITTEFNSIVGFPVVTRGRINPAKLREDVGEDVVWATRSLCQNAIQRRTQ